MYSICDPVTGEGKPNDNLSKSLSLQRAKKKYNKIKRCFGAL